MVFICFFPQILKLLFISLYLNYCCHLAAGNCPSCSLTTWLTNCRRLAKRRYLNIGRTWGTANHHWLPLAPKVVITQCGFGEMKPSSESLVMKSNWLQWELFWMCESIAWKHVFPWAYVGLKLVISFTLFEIGLNKTCCALYIFHELSNNIKCAT